MKKFLLFIFSFACSLSLFASHIVGGEVFYTYLGPGAAPNTSKYRVTLRLFTGCGQICGNGTQVACPPTNALIGIFNNSSPYSRVVNLSLPRTSQIPIDLTTYSPCLDSRPPVCYNVNTYEANVDLANTAAGYRMSYQNCCRALAVNVLNNAASVNGSPGATYETILPGTNTLPVGNNSNAVVNLKDTALICKNSYFRLEFSAEDPDNDSLVYSFSAAYNGGTFVNNQDNNPPDAPSYGNVSYDAGYSGGIPMGQSVLIDQQTGVISGVSPNVPGSYVINVIIYEFRGGNLIAQHRKDFQIKVNDCSLPTAQLDPIPVTCDGFNVSFQNNGGTQNINNWYWDFGVPSLTNDTSNLQNPTFVYPDTGTFVLKLVVNRGGICTDSATTLVRVYPGFFPGFRAVAPFCKGTPIQFLDTTRTRYGTVAKWLWDFGDNNSVNNNSINQNPSHTFNAPGTYTIRLTVDNTKGCSDTSSRTILVNDNTPINLRPRDTTICYLDTLQLNTNAVGSFSWTPNYNINSLTSPNPLISPDVTTTYYVSLTNSLGCVSRDSVLVKVKFGVALQLPADTTICRTDPIVINIQSDALYYKWTPATYLNNATIKTPTATPLLPQVTYHVVASIGKCVSEGDYKITTLPYPNANAGPGDSICFRESTQLQASGGLYYQWTPSTFLSATNIPNPRVISATSTTQYIVAVRDTVGCRKPAFDTVLIVVDPEVIADAGPRDTSIVMGQPLVLQGTGGVTYEWDPTTWLSNPNVANPVALPEGDIEYHLLVKSRSGCSDRDSIRVKYYRVAPGFYVPTAFSPNGDGNNDLFKPILLGMKSLNYFRVYNRLGELVYATSTIGNGWDGYYKGNPQDPAAFVWMAEGVTYKGEVIRKQGNMVLVR